MLLIFVCMYLHEILTCLKMKQLFGGNAVDLDVLIREEILLGKVACLHLVGAHKGAVLRRAGEVADTLHAAIVLAQGLIILNTDPDAGLELGQT